MAWACGGGEDWDIHIYLKFSGLYCKISKHKACRGAREEKEQEQERAGERESGRAGERERESGSGRAGAAERATSPEKRFANTLENTPFLGGQGLRPWTRFFFL